MPLNISCPLCLKPFSVDESTAGRKARCTQCGQVFRVPAPRTPAGVIRPNPAGGVYELAETPRSSPARGPAPSRGTDPEPPSRRREFELDDRVYWGLGAVAATAVGTIVMKLAMQRAPHGFRVHDPEWAAAILLATALFGLVPAVFDWDWWFELRKARMVTGILGRTGARVLYIVFGGLTFGAGVEYAQQSLSVPPAAPADGALQDAATAPPDPSSPAALPSRPLDVAQPLPPPQSYRGQDLSTAPAAELAAAASAASRDGQYADAAQLQYWAFAADDDGLYNLACYCALAGQRESAFYWLQEAAHKEGVDANWAGEDPDLRSLRQDRRWSAISRFLTDCNRYWSASDCHSTTVVVPRGYTPGTPIGVVVGLHGMSSRPEDFVNEQCQDLADALNMAFVGVSGTVPRGPRSFVWSEDPTRDAAQIRRALREAADRVTARKGEVVLYGFSQGAQMAFEVAFRFPDEFRGALVMSPGTRKTVNLAALPTQAGNRSQGYVCTCGAGELPGNVAYTRADAEHAQHAGARTELKLYDGVNAHTLPPDFGQRFPEWVKFILGGGGAAAPLPATPSGPVPF